MKPRRPSRAHPTQNPGDPKKTADAVLDEARAYLRDEVEVESVVTVTILSHIFDLVPAQATRLIELLLQEGLLVRSEEWGGMVVKALRLPSTKK